MRQLRSEGGGWRGGGLGGGGLRGGSIGDGDIRGRDVSAFPEPYLDIADGGRSQVVQPRQTRGNNVL